MWAVYVTLLVFGYAQAKVRLDPLVDTNQGLIKGLKADNGDYSMFLGIPYAKVNESNPFGVSAPYPKFDTVYEAFDESERCPQVDEFDYTVGGSLDCLHLNIYVPNKASTRNKLPVLVYIYGGGFEFGHAGKDLYGPTYLVQHDVVFVTFNYRVGPYGFLCLNIPEVPGNQGLKDQLLALRWVNENIAAFGGDVNKITIMGESAGAASVDFHLLSKQEKLFNQVIMQSGSTLGPWAIVPSDTNIPINIASKLGFETEDLYAALSFLSNVNSKLIIAASADLSYSYRPCVEKEFDNVESFVTEHPIHSTVPKAASTPVLAGFNSDEQLIGFINQPPEYYENLDIFKDHLDLVFNFGDDNKVMEDLVRHFYVGDKNLSDDVKWGLINFSSDFNFAFPAYASINKLLYANAPNIYHYVFSYDGERNFNKNKYNVTEKGTAHADELSYLFEMSRLKEEPSTNDQLVIDRITTLWTNFVKYGNPTPETTELLPVSWLPVSKDVFNYLEINSELTLGTRPFHARLTFWELFLMTNYGKLKAFQ